MTEPLPADWSGFHAHSLGRPAREAVRRLLMSFRAEQCPPGVAVDLGAGSGADTLEMLRSGWTVHALEPGDRGRELILQQATPEMRPRLHLHAATMEDFAWPPCDLVWSGWTLPYCRLAHWPVLLDRVQAALRPGGRFAGDVFGPDHAWATEEDVMTLDETTLRAHLAARFEIEGFDTETGPRPAGGGMTRWHAFVFTVRPRAR